MIGSFAGMLERQRARRRAEAEEQHAAIAALECRLERYLAGLDRGPSPPAGDGPAASVASESRAIASALPKSKDQGRV